MLSAINKVRRFDGSTIVGLDKLKDMDEDKLNYMEVYVYTQFNCVILFRNPRSKFCLEIRAVN